MHILTLCPVNAGEYLTFLYLNTCLLTLIFVGVLSLDDGCLLLDATLWGPNSLKIVHMLHKDLVEVGLHIQIILFQEMVIHTQNKYLMKNYIITCFEQKM